MNAEREALREMLQALEHVLDTADRAGVVAGQLIAAQRTDKPLSPATLQHYEAQLSEFATNRERMRELIAQWWTMVEEQPS